MHNQPTMTAHDRSRPFRIHVLVALAVSAGILTHAQQSGRFMPSADGLTVKDNLLHVTWAADLNLPANDFALM